MLDHRQWKDLVPRYPGRSWGTDPDTGKGVNLRRFLSEDIAQSDHTA